MALELGLDTFGDISTDDTGARLSAAQVIRNTVTEGILADQTGVDYIGLGEHHRPDFAISAPEPIMTAILTQTQRIKVGTSVTVLSSDDPIRLYQRFATMDAIAPQRAEVTLGRGSFTESFPLFGLDLHDYETLFDEKYDLFLRLIRDEQVSFDGQHRAPLHNVTVHPRAQTPIRTWRGVGGSPESVISAAVNDLPLLMAIIGGNPARFAPLVDLYKRAHDQVGTPSQPIGVHSPGFVAATDEEARETYFEGYQKMHAAIGASRGWPPLRRQDYLHEIENGSLYVGSPETVAQKIASTVSVLGLSRFQLKYSSGPQKASALLRNVELYGQKVIPRVREILTQIDAL
ncbi:luciferase [Thioclava sp. SK-1]|uniref:LLM class flavin-dependent oxidoreductase n=1 Tax=Thioclava sp. SK-1 TaxID=1889770 RepID=UPI000825BF6A|nr:LLM class flavin-dependent oxidoreductase [Thioclava sp. SK-1]OCX65767.1 luciferase [Thioclava sp. SK-1]